MVRMRSAAGTKLPMGFEVGFSEDGRYFFCVGRRVVVFETRTLERVWTSTGISHPSHAAFSPSGSLLAIKSTAGNIVVRDLLRSVIALSSKAEGEGCEIQFGSEEALVDGSWNGFLTVRTVSDGKMVHREIHDAEMVSRITRSRDRRFWLVEHNPIVREGENWPKPRYMALHQWPFGSQDRTIRPDRPLSTMTLSPDVDRFCAIERGRRNRIVVGDTETGSVIAVGSPIELGGTGHDLVWSNDGQLIVSVQEGAFAFYRATDLKSIARVECEYPASIAFRPLHDDVLLGSWDASTLLSMEAIRVGDVKSVK
jgi:hypothetical protein